MGGRGGVGSWAGMGLINYDGIDCEFFSLVLCLNCANLHVPCCNWLRINTIYIMHFKMTSAKCCRKFFKCTFL